MGNTAAVGCGKQRAVAGLPEHFLPEELVDAIIALCGLVERCVLARTCKHLRTCVLNPAHWRTVKLDLAALPRAELGMMGPYLRHTEDLDLSRAAAMHSCTCCSISHASTGGDIGQQVDLVAPCGSLTDAGLTTVLTMTRNVKKLSVCNHTHISLNGLLAVLHCCPLLEHLDLRRAIQTVGNEGNKLPCGCLDSLRTLVLDRTSVGCLGLRALIACMPHLEHLSLQFAWG